MNYEGHIIRPPSEAASIILQVTVGCSHNKCSFCGAYKGVLFRVKDEGQIDEDLQFAASHFPKTSTLFLADGDALTLPQTLLVALLLKIRQQLPSVKRVRLYGSAKSILTKSLEQLQELRNLGLDRVYMGLESGDDQTLKDINKWGDSRSMIEAACRVKDAAIFLSVTVLLGIAGVTRSTIHAEETARVLNEMAPNQIAALTLMLVPGTKLFDRAEAGEFRLPSPREMLIELRTLILALNDNRCQFQANHASNYLPINCRLPRDRDKVLLNINCALKGTKKLMPEYLRGL